MNRDKMDSDCESFNLDFVSCDVMHGEDGASDEGDARDDLDDRVINTHWYVL